ncbi:beta-propeller domain-containing protein [Nocardioides speluncae]|uniref:beta-propeller domain-containing protein n=1 Tax=Nocardioides speluncae TaxID=2670337 RepID=UPI000D68C837|nr:beta-propeller domain-containing protein [Nocardioides speluncae]
MGGRQRAGIAIAAVGILGAGFAAGNAFGGGSGGSAGNGKPDVTGEEIKPVSDTRALKPVASCEDLLAYYVDQGLERVTAWGWDGPMLRDELYMSGDFSRSDGLSATAPGAAEAAPVAPKAAESSETGTNVQEAGVDEPDVVKTNGELLVRIEGGRLTTYDVSGSAPERLASLRVPGVDEGEILLVGTRVVVLDSEESGVGEPTSTVVVTVDVSAPDAPEVVQETTYDTGLVSARQFGDTVRLVVEAGLPDLDFVLPGDERTENTAERRNEKIVRESTLDDWLPHVTDGDGKEKRLLDCGDVRIPDENAGLGTVAIVSYDAAEPTERHATGVVADTDIAYASTDRIYLATRAGGFGWCCWDVPIMEGDVIRRESAPSRELSGTTELHSFTLEAGQARYEASGSVDGSVANSWSMDSYDGVLRVAVGATEETGNFNSIVTLEEDAGELIEVGRLDKLGVNEDIKSMRWFDGLAIMVTFRQVDPLYAVDLSSPEKPKLIGQLKIPGYSSYLHPIAPKRIIGVGQAGGGWGDGAQVGLFNTEDLSKPSRLSQVTYGRDTTALAGVDPRQFTWLRDKHTALTVISKGYDGRTGYVSVLELHDGKISNRMIEAEYGNDVADVRLVPLPSGKVVLVTGDDISFLKL